MKNILSLFLIAFISFTVTAQRKNTKDLKKFTQLKVYDRIIVSLVKSNVNKIVITGDDKDEVSISNKNGLLKVRMEFDNFLDGGEAKATLYYTESLSLIDANENAKVTSEETFKGNYTQIKGQEGGKVDLKVDLESVYIKSISGSEITLSGNANKQEINVNTGGKAFNKNLETKDTNVVVMAGGRADVKASDNVEAKVKAGGYIYIYGNPKNIEKDKMFGGKIKIMD
ncbi:head GIN domain-containing protein [uncultured Maribacter sp.]|uniref:head GIN domain-containing protein n=1 Tax=uncultured Maribacter sp. TaxID=431308 RepID=UPI00262D716F|nr:head GIN domain-containing protein [uncultured Maribacter sp.]